MTIHNNYLSPSTLLLHTDLLFKSAHPQVFVSQRFILHRQLIDVASLGLFQCLNLLHQLFRFLSQLLHSSLQGAQSLPCFLLQFPIEHFPEIFMDFVSSLNTLNNFLAFLSLKVFYPQTVLSDEISEEGVLAQDRPIRIVELADLSRLHPPDQLVNFLQLLRIFLFFLLELVLPDQEKINSVLHNEVFLFGLKEVFRQLRVHLNEKCNLNGRNLM